MNRKRWKAGLLTILLTLLLCSCGRGTFLGSDGTYQVDVSLSGGSGKASVASPAVLTVSGGKMTAQIQFSSPYFDYVIVGKQKYTPLNRTGNAEFAIPVTQLDADLPIVADTVAMSKPHEIAYTIRFDSSSLKQETSENAQTAGPSQTADDTGAAGTSLAADDTGAAGTSQVAAAPQQIDGLQYEGTMPLQYANGFQIDQYQEGYSLITVKNSGRYLVVPQGKKVPEGLPSDVTILQQPLQRIYLAASSAMALFDAMGQVDRVSLSGTQADGWTIPSAKQAMLDGKMVFAGKYSQPDYELLVSSNCDLAVESTMILHTPKVKEMIEQLGIPVFTDRSSYESHPLGRTEWIKVYGVLLNQEKAADDFFKKQAQMLASLKDFPNTGKTVVYFYVNSDGTVVIRRPDDYIAKMIQIGGGQYAFSGQKTDPDTKSSVIRLSMEEFYAKARNADFLIYDSTIDPIHSLQDLTEKNALFQEFQAVKNKNVWTNGENMYQHTDTIGQMTMDIHLMLTGGAEKDMTFLKKL